MRDHKRCGKAALSKQFSNSIFSGLFLRLANSGNKMVFHSAGNVTLVFGSIILLRFLPPEGDVLLITGCPVILASERHEQERQKREEGDMKKKIQNQIHVRLMTGGK